MKQSNFHTAMLKIKRTALLAVGLTLFQVLAWAGPRSFQQAQAIAERQAALQGIVMDQQQVSKARKQYQQEGSSSSETATSYYVFDNGADKGFTIVSGDDELPEIVGYSAHGNSENLMKTEGCAAFLKAYQKFVAAFTQGDAKARKILAEQRAQKADGRYQQSKIAPLLGDIAWDQLTPYNKMCPKYKGSNLSATGCVATAMAQVMMYYQYPKELKTTIPAYTTTTNKLKVKAISKGEEYDWDNMLPTYTKGKYTATQADAVAKLMFHCGAAVQMDYGDSSGAWVLPEDMSTYFGYDADLLQEVYRSFYTLAEWKEILDRELEAKRLSFMAVLLLMKAATSLYAMVLTEKVSITSTGAGQATAMAISTSPSSTLQSVEQVPAHRLTAITAPALSSSVLHRTTESRMNRW